MKISVSCTSIMFHCIVSVSLRFVDLLCCSVPELCSVLGSGSLPALQWWLSSVLDCCGSEKLFSPALSVPSITTTRACSFSFSVPHSPGCSSCSWFSSSLGSAASTELALSMVRSARLPSWFTSLNTRKKLLHTKKHVCRLTHTCDFYTCEDFQ